MNPTIGPALTRFEQAIRVLQSALEPYPELRNAVFQNADEWLDLLTYKLVPHLAGEGCLVVVVAGGTNTGKSTVFNLLNGTPLSPTVNTAAATCHPVLAANARRAAECLDGKLMPEFTAQQLTEPSAPVDHGLPPDTLLVAENPSLPDSVVIMDTPDVDSIDTTNWEIAEHIRAAGDVLVAVLTGEKYKDRRVVEFFREAHASGRVIAPLMNKANPAEDYAIARAQVIDFQQDTGADGPGFVLPHDFELADRLDAPVRSLDGEGDLWSYLQALDVHATKERVYRSTIARFAEQAAGFVDDAHAAKATINGTIAHFEEAAAHFAERYDPAPGEAVGGLFHEFVQERRGTVRRFIGATSATLVRGASAAGRRLASVFTTGESLDPQETPKPGEITERHQRQIERIVRDLLTHCTEMARQLEGPLGPEILAAAQSVDVEPAQLQVGSTALGSDDISEEFREHAMRTLDAWWNDHRGQRAALESLDTALAVMPAGIAVPISIYTGGVGAGEAAAVAGAMTATFVAKVMELQFGDAMFDFLSPWKAEQQELLRGALLEAVVTPIVAPAREMLDPLTNGTLTTLEDALEACRKA